MLMGAFKAAMDVHISYKFGGLLSCTAAVNAAQLCTAGGSTFEFRYYSLGGDTAMPDGLYASICHVFLVLTNIFGGRPRSNKFSGTTGWTYTNFSGIDRAI